MFMNSFSLARLPRIEFGAGTLNKLPMLARRLGTQALIVTGSRSFRKGTHWAGMEAGLQQAGVSFQTFSVKDEPSPELVDSAVQTLRHSRIDVVIGIGGGSALDAAKAIAGLLKPGNSVMDHLEGVGPELPYQGPSTPFIAVPTTAGTGSEATRNAVLSVRGKNGFKKSFRDEQLVAEYAVVDPDLLASCPRRVIAANGMDAVTQLLESYVSSKASPVTDSLAWGALKAARDGLLAMHRDPADAEARSRMAYAALISGITLAQAGLGAVHGLAAPLGAFFPIPHGAACGTLVAEATRRNIEAMRERDPDSPALKKYALVGRLLSKLELPRQADAHDALLETLASWTHALDLPRLGHFGVTHADMPSIVANCRGSSMKTNPIVLRDDELGALLQARL